MRLAKLNKMRTILIPIGISLITLSSCSSSSNESVKQDCLTIKNAMSEVNISQDYIPRQKEYTTKFQRIWMLLSDPKLSGAVKTLAEINWDDFDDSKLIVIESNGNAILNYCAQVGINLE